MAYRAPFGARSTATGCGRSSASNQGGGAAGEWPESGRRRALAAAGVRAPAVLALWRSGGEAGGFYVLLVRFGARWCARL